MQPWFVTTRICVGTVTATGDVELKLVKMLRGTVKNCPISINPSLVYVICPCPVGPTTPGGSGLGKGIGVGFEPVGGGGAFNPIIT